MRYRKKAVHYRNARGGRRRKRRNNQAGGRLVGFFRASIDLIEHRILANEAIVV